MKYFTKMIFPLYLLFLFLAFLPDRGVYHAQAHGQIENPIEITTKIAIDVKDRAPVGVDSIFSATVGKVYCWSAIVGIQDTVTLYHVWNFDGQEESRVPIDITSNYFRAHSFQTIEENKTGEWTVYIVNSDNIVLSMSKFYIQQPTADTE